MCVCIYIYYTCMFFEESSHLLAYTFVNYELNCGIYNFGVHIYDERAIEPLEHCVYICIIICIYIYIYIYIYNYVYILIIILISIHTS
jgi:hypothetical protein